MYLSCCSTKSDSPVDVLNPLPMQRSAQAMRMAFCTSTTESCDKVLSCCTVHVDVVVFEEDVEFPLL